MDWRAAAGFVEEVRANTITFVAGSIAHSAFLSLFPLLLLLLVLTTAVGNETLTEELVRMSRRYRASSARGCCSRR